LTVKDIGMIIAFSKKEREKTSNQKKQEKGKKSP
jgi:hypothetical protein